MNIRYKLFTCRRAGSDTEVLITLPFSADLLLFYFSPHKQTSHSPQPIDISSTYTSNSNTTHSSAHQTHNKPSSIMASKTTNAAGLTAREVDILCAMCQSLKSKPEVSLINQSSLPPLYHNYSLTLTTRPTWRSSPPSPVSPRRAVLPPTPARS